MVPEQREQEEVVALQLPDVAARPDGAECQDDPGARIDTFRREIILNGPLETDQRNRLMEIANRCPVHRSLSSPTQILSKEEAPDRKSD